MVEGGDDASRRATKPVPREFCKGVIMDNNITVYAASVGHSVWFSHDLGETWNRADTHTGGIYNESRCWCLSMHPDRPGEVLSGTDQGVYRWDPKAERWNHVPSPMDGMHILQMIQAPHDPDIIFAGTRPAEVFRSADGGTTWERCQLQNQTECPVINTPRVTSLHFDPKERDTVWATIEIDATHRSTDGGETWEKLGDGLLTEDVHNLVFIDELGQRRVLASTEEGLHRSDDNGKTFYPMETPEAPYPYFRFMARRPDGGGVIFLSVGDKPSGEVGFLLRSRDYGESWERVELPARVNSTIWWIATNPSDPNLIFFCTIMGQIFRSVDGGETWEKMERELSELRMIAWQPAA